MARISDAVTANLPRHSSSFSRVRLVSCLALVAIFSAACGGNGTSGLTGNGKSPSAGEVSIANCDGDRSVSPVTIVLSCADGNEIVEHARWSAWDATSATGTGVLTTNDCQPTCASGTFHSHNVDLVAKVPVGKRDHQTFAVLVVTSASTSTSQVPKIYQLHRGK